MIRRLKSHHPASEGRAAPLGSSPSRASGTSPRKNAEQTHQESLRQPHRDQIDLSTQAQEMLEMLNLAKDLRQKIKNIGWTDSITKRLFLLASGIRYVLSEEPPFDEPSPWQTEDFQTFTDDIIDALAVASTKSPQQEPLDFLLRVFCFDFAHILPQTGYDLTAISCEISVYSPLEKEYQHLKSWQFSLPSYPLLFPPLAQTPEECHLMLHHVFGNAKMQQTDESSKLLASCLVFDSSQPLSPISIDGITIDLAQDLKEQNISLSL